MGDIGSRSQSGQGGGLPAVPGRNSLLAAGALLVGLLGLFLLIDSTDGDVGASPALAAPELSPPLKLPWEDGQAWLTGVSGLHGGKDALDFLPPDSPLNLTVTCEGGPGWVPAESQFWVVAAAAGTVTQASDSTVIIDHGNGWISGYYHIHSFQVQPGDTVPPLWALGHPSNYGDCSTGPQVHFWALGPNGQTLRDVKISGQDATSIGINVAISETGNYPPAPGTTPTASPAATPAPSLSPTPTAAPAPEQPAIAKGDVDCDGDIDAVDALKQMRYIAGLPLSQTEPCKEIGTSGEWVFGDVDCDDDVDAVDTLKILRHVANLPVPQQTACPPTGSIPQPTPTPAPTPAPSPTAAGQGSPFSLTDLQSAWEGMGIDVMVGQPSSGFTGFGATPINVRLIQIGDSMELTVLVYDDPESASEDWALVPGTAPVALAGRSLPAHISTWWNENIVVVVLWTTGDISTATLAGLLSLGS